MNEGAKTTAAFMLASFAGCLAALLVIGLFILALLPGAIDAMAEQAIATGLNSLKSASIRCTGAYSEGSIAVELNGVAQYCIIGQQKANEDFNVDINN